MPVTSPVSDRRTVAALLLLTFATGLVDSISVLVLGGVFVANMTGNLVFLGFWFATGSQVDLTAALTAVLGFLVGAMIIGRLIRHLGHHTQRWLTVALGAEVVLLSVLSVLAATGVLEYRGATKLILIAGLGCTFGMQNATARQFGIQELSTTVLTSTLVGIGVDSRLAGGSGEREKLRFGVISAMCGGAVVGATLSRVVVAPVLAIAVVVVTAGALMLRSDIPGRPVSSRVRRIAG